MIYKPNKDLEAEILLDSKMGEKLSEKKAPAEGSHTEMELTSSFIETRVDLEK